MSTKYSFTLCGEKVFTVKGVAGKLGVDESTIIKHINDGDLSAQKCGQWWITESMLHEFLEGKYQLNIYDKAEAKADASLGSLAEISPEANVQGDP